MSIERSQISVNGLRVQIVRKAIKNLHLGVYPPHGRVRVAAPVRLGDEAVRLAVIGKLGWIKRQQARFEAQPRQTAREMVSGESHYFLGRRYRLRVVVEAGPPKVVVRSKSILELHARRDSSVEQREGIMQKWYRKQLKEMIPPLLAKWQPILGVRACEWGVKKMKIRWGTCNANARRIWVNLELVKKPAQCLEYIIVHELVHLIERNHNERFVGILNRRLPQWRQVRDRLQSEPLAHATWTY